MYLWCEPPDIGLLAKEKTGPIQVGDTQAGACRWMLDVLLGWTLMGDPAMIVAP
jgi:hypothetical protein